MLVDQIIIYCIIATVIVGGFVAGFKAGRSRSRSLILGIGLIWLFVTVLMLLGFGARRDGLEGIGYQLVLVWICVPFAVMYLLGVGTGFFKGRKKTND